MRREEVLHLFDKLNVWSRGDQRARHKPLLVLYLLARWSRGERADIPFKQVDADLTGLLKEYRQLFEAAGFQLTRTVPTRTWVSVIEGEAR